MYQTQVSALLQVSAQEAAADHSTENVCYQSKVRVSPPNSGWSPQVFFELYSQSIPLSGC